MFISSCIYSNLECWLSVNHTWIYENSELMVSKFIKVLGEISINWINDLLGTNVYIAFESCW